MQKGNYCDAVQISEGEGIERRIAEKRDYGQNRGLIEIAQSDNEHDAMKASELLIENNYGLVRSIALRFGEIRRALRDDGPIKVGRYYKKLGVELIRARNEIINNEGREPHVKELAQAVGVSAEEAAMALDAMVPPSSLSDFVYGEDEGAVLEDMLADTDSIDENQRFFDRMALREAIVKMSDQWQKILLLRYFRNKTQQEVADILGLSQVKVSREEKKIMTFLQKEMR